MRAEYKHPQIFSDMAVLFEMYYHIHEGMPKSFRVAVSDKVLSEIADAMRLAVLANGAEKKTPQGRRVGAEYIATLRSHIEVSHAMVLLGWKLRFVSNGAMAELSERFDGIVTQAVKWERWMEGGKG
jgi:hypothetical protein